MKRMNLWLLGSLLVGAMALTACSSSDDDGGVTPDIQPGKEVTPASMKMAGLSGFVTDDDGDALKGVKVTSGTESVTTGADGGFVFTSVNSVNKRTIVKFEKSGYVDVVRSMPTENGAVWNVVMAEEQGQDISNSTFYSGSAQTMTTASGMGVGFQPDGFKNASTGEAINAYVNSKVFYLNPDDDNFGAMMPGGDLAAVRSDNSEVQLVSYGMTKVDLTGDNGEALQLADGKPATLTFPVPDKFENNTPAEIPLWSFNESTGLWEEEGIATYDETNDVYVGTVTHFSWVNLDWPEVRATLNVVVKDKAGDPMPFVRVDIDGQRYVTTNANGQASCYVPQNTGFYVLVHSEDYSNYKPEVRDTVPGFTGSRTVEIVLPILSHISGSVVNKGEGGQIATLWIEYNGKSTSKVHSDVDGKFFMNAPADYTGAATLKVRAGDGTVKSLSIELDGKDHSYNVTIDSDVSAYGTIKVQYKGKEYNYVTPEVDQNEPNGVIIVDNKLMGIIEDSDDDSGSYQSMAIIIDEYSASKTSYKTANFIYMNEGPEMTELMSESAAVDISVNKNYYTFKVSGKARFMYRGPDFNWDDYDENSTAEFTANIPMPLLLKGMQKTNVTAADKYFPSFVPFPTNQAANRALVIEESPKLGKGGWIAYTDSLLTEEDYEALVAKAKSSFGEPVEEENYYGEKSIVFTSGNKLLAMEFNEKYYSGYINEDIDQWNIFSPYGRIVVYAFEDFTLPADEVFVKQMKNNLNGAWKARRK